MFNQCVRDLLPAAARVGTVLAIPVPIAELLQWPTGRGFQAPPVRWDRAQARRRAVCRRKEEAVVASLGGSPGSIPGSQALDSSEGRATVQTVCRGFDSRSKPVLIRQIVSLQYPPVAACASTRHRFRRFPVRKDGKERAGRAPRPPAPGSGGG